MAELATVRRDNPFFIRYGTILEQCFAPTLEGGDSGPARRIDGGQPRASIHIGAPISIFPTMVQGLKASQSSSDGNVKQLGDYADRDKLAFAQKKVDHLRNLLLEESQKPPGKSLPPFTQKLRDFRQGLAGGSEAMLSENPFYELTGLVYRINLNAMKNAFASDDHGMKENPPQAITVSRSFAHIWGRGSLTSTKQKIQESVAKIAAVGKIGFGLLLFAGSTMTTAKGVTDLVQLPGFVEIFGDGLVGKAHEDARFALSLFVGVVLSSIILDFKSRLFQGVAESGKVFRGFWEAFKNFPRWVILSCFFTMASIWTNYDGIVLLMSKTQDLAYQWEKIQVQVGSALGDPTDLDPDNPDSLLDLQAALQKKATEAIVKFKKVPDDEMSGSASSGIAKKGPRYYAKYFIVEGGYYPGRSDIGTTYRRSRFV